MKKICFILAMLLVLVAVFAQPVGKIRYAVGDVLYRPNQNAAWKAVDLNMTVEQGGMIKTGLDSTVEILWNSNLASTVVAGKTLFIRNLHDEVHQKQKWVSQVKDKSDMLSLQSKQRASTVAGIRRDEVEIKSQSELFWDMEPLQSLDEALELFEKRDFNLAIPKFHKVIEQGPLKKDAEIAHSYLILIYEEQKNLPAMKKQIGILREDFPRSAILDSLPKDL